MPALIRQCLFTSATLEGASAHLQLAQPYPPSSSSFLASLLQIWTMMWQTRVSWLYTTHSVSDSPTNP